MLSSINDEIPKRVTGARSVWQLEGNNLTTFGHVLVVEI
jgi:hypothetical protein